MKIVKEVNAVNYSLKCSQDGMQSKFYNPEDNHWYKEDFLGTEGLSEYVSSLLLQGSGINHVSYEPCQFKNGQKTVVGCKSENFLNPGDRLISAYELILRNKNLDITKEIPHMDVPDRIKYFVEMIEDLTGIKEYGKHLTNILQLDAITKNEDRHFNNIAFIQHEDGSFEPAPIFDNGAAFLSDVYTYGENLTYEEILDKMSEVQAKPFSLDFDEQLDACEELYPSKIKLNRDIEINKEALSFLYKGEEINKVEIILRETIRKYGSIYFSKSDPGNKEIGQSEEDIDR